MHTGPSSGAQSSSSGPKRSSQSATARDVEERGRLSMCSGGLRSDSGDSRKAQASAAPGEGGLGARAPGRTGAGPGHRRPQCSLQRAERQKSELRSAVPGPKGRAGAPRAHAHARTPSHRRGARHLLAERASFSRKQTRPVQTHGVMQQQQPNHQAPRGGQRGRAGPARGGAVQLPDPGAESFERWARTVNSKAAVEEELKTKQLDPKNLTLEDIERDLWLQAQHLKFVLGASRDMRLRYTFYRALSKGSIPTVYRRIRAAALKLLPGLQQMADRGCALRNYNGMRTDPAPGSAGARLVDPEDPTKFLLLGEYSNRPWDYGNLRADAHCESPRTLRS